MDCSCLVCSKLLIDDKVFFLEIIVRMLYFLELRRPTEMQSGRRDGDGPARLTYPAATKTCGTASRGHFLVYCIVLFGIVPPWVTPVMKFIYEFSVMPSESRPTSGGLMASVIWTNLYSSACVKPTLSRTKTPLWRHRPLHSALLPLSLYAFPWHSVLPRFYATRRDSSACREEPGGCVRRVV